MKKYEEKEKVKVMELKFLKEVAVIIVV